MPKFCEKCRHLTPTGGCHIGVKGCSAWMNWFRGHWTEIRANAQLIKEQNEEQKDKDDYNRKE